MMNYKETLLFVAKCLTISQEQQHKQTIENQLKNNVIDWEAVVRISTAHYVFPALYCQLKRANFLHYLPEDLVIHMKHITTLNRERNEQIIAQATGINELLLANNITPIFLKGTGNLLEGLYEDIAERMVGDIDFIVSIEEYEKAFFILKKSKYYNVHEEEYHFPQFKHKPRLKTKNKIAALEVHKELIIEEYAEEFNYNVVSKSVLKKDNFHFLSYENQLCLSILAKQINDNGIYFKTIALRNAYDVFLLSKKTNSLQAIKKFDKLFNATNNFLAICSYTFGDLTSISFEQNSGQKKYLNHYIKLMENSHRLDNEYKKISRFLFVKTRLEVIKKAIFRKDHRIWLVKRITDKNWLHEKLIQLKIKSAK